MPNRYTRLAQEIARDEIAARCAVIEPQLPAYFVAEKVGETHAREVYPEVWLHLQGCDHCRARRAALKNSGTVE